MTTAFAIDWFRQMLFTAVITAGPAVLTVVIVSLVVAIIQAATQVNDQAIAFGPKAIAVVIALSVGGAWMLEETAEFTRSAIGAMATVTR